MNKIHQLLHTGLLRLVDSMGDDSSIVRSARVSYNAASKTGNDPDRDNKLINYLMANGHNTPFESVTITFEVKAPIFVLRQWQRHRMQSYNEVSGRYCEMELDFYVPDVDQITTQSKDNKQMKTNEQNKFAEEIECEIYEQNINAFLTYRKLLNKGCPREIARSVLPTGTFSRMFATANLHNWFNFLRERLHKHAQYEIRVYAWVILDELKNIVPEACKAFMKTLGEGYDR